MFMGLSGVVSTVDDPSTATQGTCPAGYAQYAGVCVQVTSTAPASLIETDPSKLPPASRIPWGWIVGLTTLGAAFGVAAFHYSRR